MRAAGKLRQRIWTLNKDYSRDRYMSNYPKSPHTVDRQPLDSRPSLLLLTPSELGTALP